MELVEVYKFCPRCSAHLEALDNHTMKCVTCNKFLFNSPKPVSAIILFNQKEILLGKRNREPDKGTWNLIGGFVDVEETHKAAIIRETKEEIGIELDVEKITYFGSYTGRYEYQEINYYLVSSTYTYFLDKEIELKPSDDISETKWFAFDSVPFDNLHKQEGIGNSLKDFINISL